MAENNTVDGRIELTAVHTFALGQILGEHIEAGQVIALQGDLGAGKTTLAQGIAIGMGIDDRVTSPTFTLVNEYGDDARVRLIHVDTYRLGDFPEYAVLESTTFGLEEMLDPEYLAGTDGKGAVVVIEWAERIASLLPQDHLLVQIAPATGPADLRDVMCTAFGPKSATLLRFVREHLSV